MTASVSYLENAEVADRISKAPEYRKSSVTLLRLPAPEEYGTNLETFVKDGDTVRRESVSVLSADQVIARNPGVIGSRNGEPAYNEWPIPRATAVKNYGTQIDGLTAAYTPCKKIATVRAVPVTQDILDALGVSGDELPIRVSWSTEPMIAKIGDYLTSGGYSISQHDMTGYEPA